MRFRVFLVALLSTTYLLAHDQQSGDDSWFHGIAIIDEEGTICLKLRSKNGGEQIAHGFTCYDVEHASYEEIAEHVGPIQVGEEKEIGPLS